MLEKGGKKKEMVDRIQFDLWLKKEQCERLQKRFGDYDEFVAKGGNKKNKIPIFRTVNDLLDEHSGELSLMEIGCGPGHFLWGFKEKVSKIIGIDYSLAMIKLASDQMSKHDVDQEFFTGSCWDIPLKDNAIDISLQVDVCMHIGGSWDAIKEMTRVSSKYVVFTGPGFEKFDNEMDRRIGGKSWAVSVPLLEKGLDNMIEEGDIKSYRYVDRPESPTYAHRILVINK